MTTLEQLFQSIADEEDRIRATTLHRERVRERLLVANSRKAPALSRLNRHTAWLAAAAGLVFVLGATFALERRSLDQLSARDLHGNVPEGAWVSALANETHPLSFSDGSSVALAEQSRARLVHLAPRGAHVSLEAGRANVTVVHQPDTQWKVSAGPFVVFVTGTRFDVRWNPTQDLFELALAEGQVNLAGCGFGKGRKLVAGQRVSASCKDGRVSIRYDNEDTQQATTRSLPLSETLPTYDLSAASGPLERAASPRSGNLFRESALANAPFPYAPTLSQDSATLPPQQPARPHQPERQPGSSLEQSDAEQLSLAGDAARRAGQPDQARTAYTTLRRRFAGSPRAIQAAFSLGIIEFDSYGAFTKAATWFRVYLREQPSGALAREAKGRLMEALRRVGDPDAKIVATEYLNSYPSGPHSELARRVLEPLPSPVK